MDNYLIPSEPKEKITESFFDVVLEHMDSVNASDVYFHSFERIIMDIYGRKIEVTEKSLSFTVLERIAKNLAGGEVIGRLNSGEAIDIAYETKRDGERFRYRVNIISTLYEGENGIQITVRSIDVDPPELSSIGLSENSFIYQNMFPKQGIVLVTGPTGSGKSTLMASCVRQKIEEVDCNMVFHTYEEPIEFIYDNCKKVSSRVFQTPVPTGIRSFALGIRASLRRKPEVIIIGEMRDTNTISAAIDAGMTGHLVIGTAHVTGVPATTRRLITAFPKEERDARQADIIDQLHMVVAQKLLRTVDHKRVAVRETLLFTNKMKDHLLGIDPLKLNKEIRKIMESKKIGMVYEAEEYLKQGRIEKIEFEKLAADFKGEL